MSRLFMSVFAVVLACGTLNAAAPEFPKLGSVRSVRGELTSVDFIHRTGSLRTTEGKLLRFSMPPFGIVSYLGTESDLRDVPLGDELEFLLLPDEEGELSRLVGTKDGDKDNSKLDADQRKRFVDFTKDRGLAGWIESTTDDTVTVTFFSGNPELFDATWLADFTAGAEVRVCVANDELRTWQPTSCGERGTMVEVKPVPIEGLGSSGRRAVVRMNHMLEGFRPGRVVRIFGSGWKIRNQNFQECLINYGYSARPVIDFRECAAKHYPEHYPFRTDHGNRHLSWYQATDGSEPPLFAEHVMFGDLTEVDPSGRGGAFRLEPTGEAVKFMMLETGSRWPAALSRSDNIEGRGVALAELPLGRRYRFHMFQDEDKRFSRCSFICDDYSRATQNNLNYRIRSLDLKRGLVEVDWQSVPVLNYQKDLETPPPYGRCLLSLTAETQVWTAKKEEAMPAALKVGDLIKFNRASELPGRPTYCTDVWIVDLAAAGAKKKAK
jgi:hypothetical protein